MYFCWTSTLHVHSRDKEVPLMVRSFHELHIPYIKVFHLPP